MQACFFLSTAEIWSAEDGDFNLEYFHAAIVQLFESDMAEPTDNEWVVETLQWWDR